MIRPPLSIQVDLCHRAGLARLADARRSDGIHLSDLARVELPLEPLPALPVTMRSRAARECRPSTAPSARGGFSNATNRAWKKRRGVLPRRGVVPSVRPWYYYLVEGMSCLRRSSQGVGSSHLRPIVCNEVAPRVGRDRTLSHSVLHIGESRSRSKSEPAFGSS